MKRETIKISYSALCLCLALLLPLLTGGVKVFGKMINPMHIAIFLCGLSCGAVYGAIIGAIAPLLRSVIFGMPTLFPSAVGMAFELCAYGLFSGLFFKLFYNKKCGVYISLILAMLIGRIVWGITTLVLWRFMGDVFTFALFIKGAFVDSVVGIAIQLIIIPIIIHALKRANLLFITTT